MEWRRHSRLPGIRAGRLAGLGLLAVVLAVVADRLLLPLAVRGFVRVIELIMNAGVWVAVSLSVGMDVWGILGVVGRAASGLVDSRQASVALTLMVAVGVLAAYGLQKMLGFPGDTGEPVRQRTGRNNRTKEESSR